MVKLYPKDRIATEFKYAFMVMEATSFAGGGFPGFMNKTMEKAKAEMIQAGVPGPYKWKFMGGDGVTVPTVLVCYKD
jgi:hypothetical protein